MCINWHEDGEIGASYDARALVVVRGMPTNPFAAMISPTGQGRDLVLHPVTDK